MGIYWAEIFIFFFNICRDNCFKNRRQIESSIGNERAQRVRDAASTLASEQPVNFGSDSYHLN